MTEAVTPTSRSASTRALAIATESMTGGVLVTAGGAAGSAKAFRSAASAVNPQGSLETRPLAIDPKAGATVQPLPHEPLRTTTSYADDEALVFKGTREELRDAPAFDPAR